VEQSPHGVLQAIAHMKNSLPFTLRSVDTDNDS